jgi:predicted ester cyclase
MPGNGDILTSALAAWNAGDLESYLSIYDEDIRLHGYTPEPMDKVAVRAFYREVVANLSAPGAGAPRMDVLRQSEAGDWVSCAFTMTGVQSGPFMGVPASGRPFRIGGVTMLRFGPRGRVVERFSSADFLALMVQIGAVAMPG